MGHLDYLLLLTLNTRVYVNDPRSVTFHTNIGHIPECTLLLESRFILEAEHSYHSESNFDTTPDDQSGHVTNFLPLIGHTITIKVHLILHSFLPLPSVVKAFRKCPNLDGVLGPAHYSVITLELTKWCLHSPITGFDGM